MLNPQNVFFYEMY